MKKITALLIILGALSSCYEDYVKDFDVTHVYFTHQNNVRTLVVGEGMQIKIGVVLGGVMENNRDRIVEYRIDNSLINSETLDAMKGGMDHVKSAVESVSELKLLPDDYYTLSDNGKFIINKGTHNGIITLKADSLKFLSDPGTLDANYAIPLMLVQSDEPGTILETKSHTVIGLKYENMLFGNYWHGGVTLVKDESGIIIEEIKYYTVIPSLESKVWNLKTVSPHSLSANGISHLTNPSKAEMLITLNEEGSVNISSMPGATFEVLPDGNSFYNQAKLLQARKIILNYKYINSNGNWCYAQDTLTFRNRIRDGVNEWQDENPDNYK